MKRFFDIIKEYKDKDINLPKRSTKASAGYDFESAEMVVIPSLWKEVSEEWLEHKSLGEGYPELDFLSISEYAQNINPTMIPTGIKASMFDNEFILLSNRSSNPRKGLIMATGSSIIDADYFNNKNNEGHIMFPFFNISPRDIKIEKGQRIGQGVFQSYLLTENDNAQGKRFGGFGSTNK